MCQYTYFFIMQKKKKKGRAINGGVDSNVL
jgi:hypothetical protein